MASNVGYVSWSRISDSWDQYAAWYATYSSEVTAYEILRDEYNTALQGDSLRRSSPIALITSALNIPSRPCPPDQPPAYAGFQWYSGTTWFGNWNSVDRDTSPKNIGITTGASSQQNQGKQTGFLQASIDVTAGFLNTANNAGHIFGRLGQGEKNDFTTVLGASTKGFQWHTTVDSNHNMLVSLLPYDLTTAITTG